MNNKYLFLIILIFYVVACNSNTTSDKKLLNRTGSLMSSIEMNDKLCLLENGLFVKELDSNINDFEKVNGDNKIYTIGSKFTYSYEYIKNGEHFLIQRGKKEWELIQKKFQNPKTLTEITLEILSLDIDPNYPQTKIKYNYGNLGSSSNSGLIENRKNVWLHPPRSFLFKITQLNPFPFIQEPYKIGTEWNWYLQIGDHYSDRKWKLWEGSIMNYISYKIIEQRAIDTPFGILNCFIVEGTAESKLGKTKLVAYFNPDFGFVKLNYLNLDGSNLNLKLVKRTYKSPFRDLSQSILNESFK